MFSLFNAEVVIFHFVPNKYGLKKIKCVVYRIFCDKITLSTEHYKAEAVIIGFKSINK